MNSNQKLYLYSGLAIALSVVAYVVITKKKKPLQTTSNEETENATEDVTTSTGDTITVDQATIDPTLTEIIKLPLAQVKSKMVNKTIYTKVDEVNPRGQPFVNNGVINNTYGGKIVNKNTKIGVVKNVVEDSGKVINPQGNVYKWFAVISSQEAVDSINQTQNFWNRSLNKGDVFYVREDVIKL
jgi:hypothetical protein